MSADPTEAERRALSDAQTDAFTTEATSGDHDHVLQDSNDDRDAYAQAYGADDLAMSDEADAQVMSEVGGMDSSTDRP